MRHRYSFLDPELLRQLLAGMDLMRFFQQLLLATGGDVEEALEWMKRLQRQGVIDPSVDLDAFVAQLEEKQLLGRSAEGELQLTGAGERRLRRSAYEELFTSMTKGGAGYHPVAASGDGIERQPETR